VAVSSSRSNAARECLSLVVGLEAMKVFEPTVGEWAPRCHVAGGPLRRVVLTNASWKLHNQIRTYSSGATTCLWRRPARQSCVLNQGVTSLTALRVTPAHPSPVGHPLIRQIPNSNTAKRLARHRVPTLRAEVRPSTEQHTHPRADPKRPVNAAAPRPINPIPH
jgi:hypothetical protein